MFRSPFTASQWRELEHQALILKYLLAGVPIPSDLLLPIRTAFASVPTRLYPNPTLSYCSYFGKKLDPEPGRCRRTDGKKWRCSKDVYPDSKYCERHMHRSKNRSRKHVESQTLSSSGTTSLRPIPSSGRSFGNVSLRPFVLSGGNLQGAYQLHLTPHSPAMGNKEIRPLHGAKPEVDQQSCFSESSNTANGIGVDSSLNSSWPCSMPSWVSTSSTDNIRTPNSCPQLHAWQHVRQQQHSFSGSEFRSAESFEHENEWPKTRNLWSDMEEERSDD